MPKRYWLVKQEPATYSWSDLLAEGRTVWSGVRNFQARNNLRAMQVGDEVLFYHSGAEKQIVGLARVVQDPYADPTADEGDWTAVDLAPIKPLRRPVTLAEIKASADFKDFVLVRNSRLSVMPVTREQFREVVSGSLSR